MVREYKVKNLMNLINFGLRSKENDYISIEGGLLAIEFEPFSQTVKSLDLYIPKSEKEALIDIQINKRKTNKILERNKGEDIFYSIFAKENPFSLEFYLGDYLIGRFIVHEDREGLNLSLNNLDLFILSGRKLIAKKLQVNKEIDASVKQYIDPRVIPYDILLNTKYGFFQVFSSNEISSNYIIRKIYESIILLEDRYKRRVIYIIPLYRKNNLDIVRSVVLNGRDAKRIVEELSRNYEITIYI